MSQGVGTAAAGVSPAEEVSRNADEGSALVGLGSISDKDVNKQQEGKGMQQL